uniref:Alpha-galactosidase n=1 Tax=Rhizophora mucronata TaxID=61149 RepID=A0A2P2L072_RHIMU
MLSFSWASSELERASTPPRGWNSYDSFCWTISEEEFLSRAKFISQYLLSSGYEYVVVDYLWYRRKVPGAYTDSLGFDVIDEWGRMVPDPDRWPSSRDGKGFTEVAKKVHDMGLKFGIHVMRGISTQAYNANTPILDTATGGAYVESGRQWKAIDIGVKERACSWMQNGFMSVNTTLGAGRAFLRSLYEQYAEWGVDFVKNDCVFGDDLDLDEITFVSEVLKKLDRPILYSLSPGTSVTPSMARKVSGLVNMYRITGDDWDTWGDLASHFGVSSKLSAANMIGAEGLLGKSWPDLDMLPLGWLTDPGSNEGPHRKSKLNLDEQRTQMTLWAMAKSPIMFGGDVRALDYATYLLITHPTLLEINSFSSNNKEFPYVTGRMGSASKIERPTRKLGRHPMEVGPSHTHFLGLSSCKDPKVYGWSVKALDQDVDQICWKEKLEGHRPLCLYKRKPLLASDGQILYQQRIQELHLFASDGTEFCLDASSKRKLTSKEFKRTSFSVCRQDANQMWELNANGTLINNHSGLCAMVNSDEFDAVPSGIRSWIATGKRGEIYLAFFNLNPKKTVMSAKIADIAKALPRENLTRPCIGWDVWSGKRIGSAIYSITIEVETHGCALFVLNCHNREG